MCVFSLTAKLKGLFFCYGNCSGEHSTRFGIHFVHRLVSTWSEVFLSTGGKSGSTRNVELCQHFIYFNIIP